MAHAKHVQNTVKLQPINIHALHNNASRPRFYNKMVLVRSAQHTQPLHRMVNVARLPNVVLGSTCYQMVTAIHVHIIQKLPQVADLARLTTARPPNF